jgi:hypothetical protein
VADEVTMGLVDKSLVLDPYSPTVLGLRMKLWVQMGRKEQALQALAAMERISRDKTHILSMRKFIEAM